MRLGELFHLVVINIFENKFKVVLTSLGIIVGAATIVMVIAIGRGGQMDVADQFKNLSAGAIDISYDNGNSGGGGFGGGMPSFGGGPGGGGWGGGGGRGGGFSFGGGFSMGMGRANENITLSEEDVEDIEVFVPGLSAVTISDSIDKGVTGGDLESETQYTIAGVKEEYYEISNLELLVGEFITEADDENKNKVCVLGYNVAGEIFEDNMMEAYDSIIYIDGRSYTIIGILQQMGTVASGISPDDAIFVPYSTAEKYVLGNAISPQITAVAEDVNEVPEIIDNIELVLAQSYPNATFTISDAGSKMEAASSSADTLSVLLVAVASIVFIVGGIGIMNVLFVSVKERTKEIGILKALGSSKRDILLEFLLESNMISTFGGVVGIALAYALIPVAELTGMRMEPTVSGGVMALVFAIFTGTVFGFYPALKAASLIPVEALNQE